MGDIYKCVVVIPSWTASEDSYFLFNHHQNSAAAAANVWVAQITFPVKPIAGDRLMSKQMCLTCITALASLAFLCTFERFTSGVCACVCLPFWISLNKLFFALAASSPSELGTWHDNWRPRNLCSKCRCYPCQHGFIWTRRHIGNGPQLLFKPYACVYSGILGGLSIVTMVIYLHYACPYPQQFLPWPYEWIFKKKKGFHCSLILLVSNNSDISVPKAELRGDGLPKKVTAF